MLLEVADKIPHPSVPAFWCASALIGIGVCGLSLATRRAWPGLVGASMWLAGTLLWVLSFFVGNEGLPSQHFPGEVGGVYFVHLALAASVPALFVVAVKKAESLGWR